MLRRTLAVVAALAASATLAAPASGVAVDDRADSALVSLANPPGYSNIPGEDSYYPAYGDPRIDVLTYDLDLRWTPSNRELAGTATLLVRAVQDSPDFQLDLGSSMNVSSVTVGGVPAAATHTGKDLVIQSPVTADQDYQVTITYAGTPQPVRAPTSRVDVTALGWLTAKDGRVWTMQQPYGADTWYPVNDMAADKAVYTITLDVPDKFIGISNGTMTRHHVGTRMVTKFVNQHPMPSHLVTVAIGPYRKYTQTGPHGLSLTYWYPAGHSELLSPLKSTPKALTWLEGKLGRYPFERLGVVLTGGQSSMAGQTMISLGTGNYRYGNRDVGEQLVHQLVHSWYGDAVTPTDWRDLWMNEGMAEYLESRYSIARGWKPARHWAREFNRNDPYWREIYGPPGAYQAEEFAQINVFYSSARMLDRLRRLIGNTQFNQAVRAWPQEFRDQNKDRGDYIRWLEKRTGKNLGPFFSTELNDAKPTL